MRRLFAAILTVVLSVAGLQSRAAAADTFTSTVELLPIGVVPDEHGMGTVDYLYTPEDSRFSAFGFVEYSGDGGMWFTNHTATLKLGGSLGIWGEAGITDHDGSNVSLGLSFSPTVPGFEWFKITPALVSGTAEFDRTLNFAWKSKSLEMLGGRVWSEGFFRTFRNDKGHSYGQLQGWYKRGDSSWDYGCEVEVAGAERTGRCGARKTIR